MICALFCVHIILKHFISFIVEAAFRKVVLNAYDVKKEWVYYDVNSFEKL